jgi:formylglycine-generating enzyme required for sulfatase activity
MVGGAEEEASPPFEARVESFYISKLPITNEQFQAFDPEFSPARTSPGQQETAVGVSHEEAAAYCRWYAEVARKPMRLPTEVEWEYACKGGSVGCHLHPPEESPDSYQWDLENSGEHLPSLAAKKANGFGLFAMLGGVWEWTSSTFLPYPLVGEKSVTRTTRTTRTTAVGEASAGASQPGERKVLRGGSFRTPRTQISPSHRRAAAPTEHFDDVGFRVVKSLRF